MKDVQALLETLKTFVMQNPTVILVAVFVIYRIYRAMYPVPFPEDVPGSKVKTLTSLEQFDALFDTSDAAKRKLIVVDCKLPITVHMLHVTYWNQD